VTPRILVSCVATIGAVAGCNSVFGLERSEDASVPAIDAMVPNNGCADGTRELLASVSEFPKVAGCNGSWTIPGLTATGPGTATSLCAEGWHVCGGASEFRGAGGLCALGTDSSYLYVTAQQSSGGLVCTDSGSNELFGCGFALGLQATSTCLPLDTAIGTDTAATNGPWDVGLNDAGERDAVTKAAGPGGVLCCGNT
jgi:hypothetical protein